MCNEDGFATCTADDGTCDCSFGYYSCGNQCLYIVEPTQCVYYHEPDQNGVTHTYVTWDQSVADYIHGYVCAQLKILSRVIVNLIIFCRFIGQTFFCYLDF